MQARPYKICRLQDYINILFMKTKIQVFVTHWCLLLTVLYVQWKVIANVENITGLLLNHTARHLTLRLLVSLTVLSAQCSDHTRRTHTMDVAIIILNSSYKDKKKYEDLPGVKEDENLMEEMMKSYTSIHQKKDTEDIRETLQTIKKIVMGDEEPENGKSRNRRRGKGKNTREVPGKVEGDKDVEAKEKMKVDEDAKDSRIKRLHFHFS